MQFIEIGDIITWAFNWYQGIYDLLWLILPLLILLIYGVKEFVGMIISKGQTATMHFSSKGLEFIPCVETEDSISFIPKTTNNITVIIKDKEVEPIYYRRRIKTFRTWISFEGYPFTLDFKKILSAYKSEITGEILGLYKKKEWVKMQAKLSSQNITSTIMNVLLGLFIGVCLTMFGLPLIIEYFGI